MIDNDVVSRVVLGKLVVALRKHQGWSQEDLAERLRVSQPTISRLERGKLEVDEPTYRRVAHAFSMGEAELDAKVAAGIKRTESAARGAMPNADGDVLKGVLKIAGLVGLAALVTFAVAALFDEWSRAKP